MKRLRLALLLATLLVSVAACGAENDPAIFPRRMPSQALAQPKGPGELELSVGWSEVPGASGYRVWVSLSESMEEASGYSFETSNDVFLPQADPPHQAHWISIAARVGNELSERTPPLAVATSTSGGRLWVSAGLPDVFDAGDQAVWTPTDASFHDSTPFSPYVCRWSFGDDAPDVVLSPCTPENAGAVSHVFPDFRYRWPVRLTVTAADGHTASSMTTAFAE